MNDIEDNAKKNNFHSTPEILRIALKKLNFQEKEQIEGLIGRDPLCKIYRCAFVIYLSILTIILLWPFDIAFPKKNGFEWLRNSQGIEFIDNGLIYSYGKTRTLYSMVKEGRGLSVEVWVATSDLEQSGPARIISYSLGSEQRNFTLGQQKNSLIFRLRTTETDLNGVFPVNEVEDVFNSQDIKHIVVSYDFNKQKVYVNGAKVSEKCCPVGTFENWNPSFPLIIGNETNWERPWLGKIYFAAIYNRPLEIQEIQRRTSRGPKVFTKEYCKDIDRNDGLLLQYCFDEGSGDIIYNRSGTNNKINMIVPKWTHQKRLSNDQLLTFRYSSGHLEEVVLNIIAFVPLGFLVHAILRKGNEVSVKIGLYIIVSGAMLSFTFEFIQYFSITRYPSLLDILHNTVGTGIGVGIDRWYTAQLRHSIENLKI